MLSVIAETARSSRAASVARNADGGDRAGAQDFSALVDGNINAAQDDAATTPENDNPPAVAAQPTADRPTNNPGATRAHSDQASAQDSAASDGPAAEAATQSLPQAASSATEIAAVVLAASPAAVAAPAQPGVQPADPSHPKDDAKPDDAAPTDDTASIGVLPIAVALIVPDPQVNAAPPQPDSADASGIAPTAGATAPAAIAAAAAAKVAADVGGAQMPADAATQAAPGAESQSGDPQPTGAQDAAAALPQPGNGSSPAAPDATLGTAPLAKAPIDDAAAADPSVQPGLIAQANEALTPSAQKPRDDAAAAASNALTGFVGTGNAITADDAAPATVAPSPSTSPQGAPATPRKTADATPAAADKRGEAATRPDESPADAPSFAAAHHHVPAADATATQPAPLTDTTAPLVMTAAPPTAAGATAGTVDTSNLAVAANVAGTLNSLAVDIAAHAKAGNSRFEIRLDPPELGRIDVRLDVDRNGQVTSRLIVEKSETLHLLRRDAPQLQQALNDAGLKTADNALQFSLRQQNQQQGRGDDGSRQDQNPQRILVVEEESVAADTASRFYARARGSSGGVDMRV